MCGRFSLLDRPLVHGLMAELKVDTHQYPLRFSNYHRACHPVSIVREVQGKRIAQDAIWWLLLEPNERGFSPSRYTSFNTRYDKLNVPRSAGYKAYRESRCVIPASGFGETEYEMINGKKKPKFYHDFQGHTMALALGGLFREWYCKETGEVTTSCSVITLPPHEKLVPYHSKASPLILPRDGTAIDMWLNPEINNTSVFEPLLQPWLPVALEGQQVDQPGNRQPVGETFFIEPDNYNVYH